jgi:hypothetical protein
MDPDIADLIEYLNGLIIMASVARCSFTVEDFHLKPPAGFRRTPPSQSKPTGDMLGRCCHSSLLTCEGIDANRVPYRSFLCYADFL